MGQGRFKNGRFDLTVVANFAMSDEDWTEWERSLRKASEILFNASEGQMQFGRLFVSDDSIGLSTADIILHETGNLSSNDGRLGDEDAAIHLMPYVKRQVLTTLHELGHNAWRLGEEYSTPYSSDEIDTANPAVDNRTIPIVDSGRADNELVGGKALLTFGEQLERNAITANTATTVTVDSEYSDLPTNSDSDNVLYQFPAECAEAVDSNYCIMEKSRGAAGRFDDAGNWIEAANPVTEFCTASNHDPDGDTHQEGRHGQSCWETIVEREEFAALVVPDPAEAGPVEGFAETEWLVLDKQPRFALVLDRSGSMATGNKMADAKHGATYWLEFCAESGDMLSVIWYDHAIERILDLAQVDQIPDQNAVVDDIDALAPRGSTNIRDGLYEGLDQIQSLATRAAVHVAVLLTDGKHNAPAGSQAAEVVPDFQEAGVRIYALGVGQPDAVNMDTLDDLAARTGGRSYAVGDNQPGDVQTALVEISDEVRGGIITTAPILFPDAMPSSIDDALEPWVKNPKRKRPPLKTLLEILKVESLEQLLKPPERLRARLAAIPVPVEPRCDRVSFSLIYPDTQRPWLYLIDPNGQVVNWDAAGVHHVISRAPHEFGIVERPTHGRWHMLVLRPRAGASFTSRAVAGGENRRIQAFGGATPRNPAGAPVRIWASARWEHPLAGLRVTAVVTDPRGRRRTVRLAEARPDEPHSGRYEGYFMPERQGRHSGVIRIESLGNSIIAQPMMRMLHSEEPIISVASGAPRFIRQVPVYFDSGTRPVVKDDETAAGLVDRYAARRPRKVKLRSARRATQSQK